MKMQRTLRVALALAFLVIACSSSKAEDDGCSPNFDRHCTSAEDCTGFTSSFFGGPDKECSVVSCGADGLCKQDAIRDTDIADDIKGDCKRARCDENGQLIHLVSKSDTGGKASSTCRRMKCEDGFGGVGPIETTQLDGVRCQLEGSREGVCESGVCMAAPPNPPPPPPKTDGGPDMDAGTDASSEADAGDARDAAPDASM